MGNFIRISFIIVFALLLSNSVLAQANKVEELNLGNYFALLTPQHLPILDKFKNRDSFAKETDYPNDYMLFAQDEWKGWGEMALFKKTGGGHLVVVTQYDCQNYNALNPYLRSRKCQGNINFLELKGKQLVAVPGIVPDEKSLMLYRFYEKKIGRLANGEDKLIYELPRERKDIRIILSGEIVYSLKWNGLKFEGSYVE